MNKCVTIDYKTGMEIQKSFYDMETNLNRLHNISIGENDIKGTGSTTI